MKPHTPMIIIAMSFKHSGNHSDVIDLRGKIMSSSRNGGMMKASEQHANAPIKLIRSPKSGRPRAIPAEGEREISNFVMQYRTVPIKSQITCDKYYYCPEYNLEGEEEPLTTMWILILQFITYLQLRVNRNFKKIHWNIELYKITGKYSIGIVELSQ